MQFLLVLPEMFLGYQIREYKKIQFIIGFAKQTSKQKQQKETESLLVHSLAPMVNELSSVLKQLASWYIWKTNKKIS